MATFLQAYGCTTAAGAGAKTLFGSLVSGRSHCEGGLARATRTPGLSALDQATQWLVESSKESGFVPQGKLGVILASTKGVVEDYRKLSGDWAELPDALYPILENFLVHTGWQPSRKAVVSNACSSTHGALFLAESWLSAGLCESVAIAAVDVVGDFIEKGFRSLQAVSRTYPRPFSADRDGLALGDGGAILVLSTKPSDIVVEKISIITEGVALTRPAPSAIGLESACRNVIGERDWDLIVAHGTGTQQNDDAEARVFGRLAPQTPVTGVKWCVGHTLGVSGALDLISACEVLRQQSAFALGCTETTDPAFTGKFLVKGGPLPRSPLRRVLVTSLGFGGMNGAVTLRIEGGL